MTSFPPILWSANGFRYPTCSYHLQRIVGWLPCILCLAFLSKCFALWNITCLSETPCVGPRLELLLMTNPRIEVKSQLVFWNVVGLREYFKFLPQLQYMIPNSVKALQSRHWCFAQFSQSSKISVWFMSTSNCCESSLNLLILLISCIWLMSLRNCSLCGCFSNISISFVTLFLSPCILQVHRWDRHTKYSVISSVASDFSVALRILLRFPKWSCFLYK